MKVGRTFERRRIVAAFMALACACAVLASTPARDAEAEEGSLPAALIRKGLAAKNGTIVRREDSLRVTRVVVKHQGKSVRLFVVRVGGSFPPRALRYVVRADGHRIGFGVPVADGSAVRVVTRDRSVLSSPVTARYGGPRLAEGAQALGGDAGATVTDPGDAGPFETMRRRYGLGAEVFQPTDIGAKVEIVGEVHHPVDLASGPFPLVMFLHGNHSTCYRKKRSFFEWPCRPGSKPIPNFAGYAYIASRLASHGYVVVSISANGVNALGSRLGDTAMRQRGELLDRHLELWEQWSSTGGAFGDAFVGAVDMTRIGTMGHSRGGEGVVWHKKVDDERPDPFGIDAVLALAPVDFTRIPINNVPFATVLPVCDGDVSDLQGVHFYDDSRYNVAGDTGPKHAVTLAGANHNFFNEVWSPSSRFPGAMDDGEFSGCFGRRLGERRQRRIGRAYISGFFRRYVGGEPSLDPMWTGEAVPGFMSPSEVAVSYHAPDDPTRRRDVGRFTTAADLSRNDLGGDMEPEALSHYAWCAGRGSSPCITGDERFRDRHAPGLARGIAGWSRRTAELGSTIPVGSRDLSTFDAFQFRALVPPGFRANRQIKFQDLSVALIDGTGAEAEVAASEVGNSALAAPRGYVPHFMLQQVRFPLVRFAGVDLTDVREVELRFDRMRAGVIQISDANFTRGGG
jgi:hypothetical protein